MFEQNQIQVFLQIYHAHLAQQEHSYFLDNTRKKQPTQSEEKRVALRGPHRLAYGSEQNMIDTFCHNALL